MGGGILLNIYNTLHLVKKEAVLWQKIYLVQIDILELLSQLCLTSYLSYLDFLR